VAMVRGQTNGRVNDSVGVDSGGKGFAE
jgi:hypothetical protein